MKIQTLKYVYKYKSHGNALYFQLSFKYKKLTTSHHPPFFISLPPHPKNNIPATLFTGFKINHLQQQIIHKATLSFNFSSHSHNFFGQTHHS
jgi:hypothetical protein